MRTTLTLLTRLPIRFLNPLRPSSSFRPFSTHRPIKFTVIDHNDPDPIKQVESVIANKEDESQKITDPFHPSHIPLNLMTLLQSSSIEIEGACGGELSCSTCHILLKKNVYDSLGDVEEEEEDMLDLAYGYEEGRSRLGCQICYGKIHLLEGSLIEIPEDPF
mmetsp:Transcript_22364/g.42042  ORF Transcript_22364/g.42042 Transcript_22364/m.42042 type:complete len:162 (+) Transcript_22364:93-578(+)